MNRSIFSIGIVWGIFETAYFGWSLAPQSDAEIICDGIGFLILALAFVCPTPQRTDSGQ